MKVTGDKTTSVAIESNKGNLIGNNVCVTLVAFRLFKEVIRKSNLKAY